tara:strand:+ start:1506 stop:2627 length:1122 start_codon:yes stop_codon:yes gene_type:complete
MTENIIDLEQNRTKKIREIYCIETAESKEINLSNKGHEQNDLTLNGKVIAKWLGNEWFDLKTIKPDSEKFSQEGTKQRDKAEKEVEEMVNSLCLSGYDYDNKIPLPALEIGTENIINGRIRIEASAKIYHDEKTVEGTRWIGCGIYEWCEGVTALQRKAYYNAANVMPPHTIQNKNTFVNEVMDLILSKDLKPTQRAISDYVKDVSVAPKVFSDRGGMLQRIINECWKKVDMQNNNDILQTRTHSRETWQKICSDQFNIKLTAAKRVIVCADYPDDPARCLTRDILPNMCNPHHNKPTEIILFTTSDNSGDATKAIKGFQGRLDKIIMRMFEAIMKVAPSEIPPDFYVIKGAVPQIIGKHDIKGNKLIPINKY